VLQGEREMARDNKTLGNFHLDGIPAAPRGVPQIEVTFDIDANGIVNVSAKDLGTGAEQKITITSSTTMSKDDVAKAVKDAEMYASDDKKKREEIEERNHAEQLVYQSEKTLSDVGDKLPDSDKQPVKEQLDKLKEALKGTDAEAVKRESEELTKLFYALSEKLYKATGKAPDGTTVQQPPEGGGQPGDNGGGYYDANYEVKDDDNKNKK
jgi:molecular chaperone DnaK